MRELHSNKYMHEAAHNSRSLLILNGKRSMIRDVRGFYTESAAVPDCRIYLTFVRQESGSL